MIPDLEFGKSGLRMRPLGLGTSRWAPGPAGVEGARAALAATLAAGVTFVDTAEIYGKGASERILGGLIGEGPRPFVATKFAPLPYRFRASALPKALDRSLARLGTDAVDLYQIHWPYSLIRIEALMARLADAVAAGKVRHVGVSNYSAAQMRAAHAALAKRGVALASNQVHYSLLRRNPERNGVLAACRELGVTLIAYRPIAGGALTGKYGPGRETVTGLRRFRGQFRKLERTWPLVQELERIGAAYGRTGSQVALNWLARQPGVMPIPGARNGAQATENVGSIDFAITDDEAARLSALSDRILAG